MNTANGYAHEGSCGDNLRWTLLGGKLTISGEGEMSNFSSQAPWYDKREDIGTIEIKEGVTSIGNYAFYNCEYVADVSVASSVKTIGHYAFTFCKNLKDIVLPSGLVSIGDQAFYYCQNMPNVIIPSTVVSLGFWAFAFCKSFTTITIPAGLMSCGKGVTYSCSRLQNIDVEEGNKYFTSIDGVLFNQNRSTLVQYPPGKPSATYTIPDSVTVLEEYSFARTEKMSSVIIPNSVLSIKNQAFSGCKALTTVTIPASVTSIGLGAFGQCDSLTSINVAEGNKYYSSIDGVLFNFDNTTLLQYPGGKTDAEYVVPESVILIEEIAFYYCRTIQKVIIPDTVKSIHGGAFFICSNLENVTIGNSVESIGNLMFNACGKLKYVSIGRSVKTIEDRAFVGCSSLEKVFIPNSVTSMDHNAFLDCTSLTSIDVEDGNEYFTSIDGVLFNQNKSILIQYPSKKTETEYTVPDDVTLIESDAFSSNQYLRKVVIPDSVTSIGQGAFSSCSALLNVTIGNRVTSVGDETFSGCSKLQFVKLPASLTSIGNDAFSECSALATISLPAGLTSIGNYAFHKCSSLSTITFPSSVKTIGIGVFTQCGSITSINVEEGNKYYSSIDGVLFNHDHTTLVQYPRAKPDTTYTIPNGVSLIDDSAFSRTSKLEYVGIPDSVTEIGDWSFSRCGVKSIVIPNSVKSLGTGSFAYSSLTSLTIPDSLTLIGYAAFCESTGLVNVSFGRYVESLGIYAFDECTALADITLPESVKSIGYGAFSSCTNLKSVFYQGSHILSSDAFLSCNALNLVCVSPDYNSSSFCGRSVSSSDDVCKAFQNKFNHCFKATFIDDTFVQEIRNNASEWESETNECIECHCDNESGRIGWSKCNNSNTVDDNILLCVNDKCIGSGKAEEKYNWAVDIDIERMSIVEMNISEVMNVISEKTGVTGNKLSVGYEIDKNGDVIRVVVYLKEEDHAKLVSTFVDDIIDVKGQGEECPYDVLCRAKAVHLRALSEISISNGHQVISEMIVLIGLLILELSAIRM